MRAHVLTLLMTVGCGAGTAAEATRPKEPVAVQAECADVTAGAEPLVVDWNSEQRAELEVAMKDGVAVVAYDCEGIRLLSDCKLEGDYGYIGMKRKEQVLQLTSSDELQANLPLTGSQLGVDLERGSSLDVAMIMVGKRRSTWVGPTSGDLKGECAGATHYVRGATVGAFALASGSRANVRASAQIFFRGWHAACVVGAQADPESRRRCYGVREGEPRRGVAARAVRRTIAAGFGTHFAENAWRGGGRSARFRRG